MKDTKKILRTAIYNALGSITYNSVAVPVKEEKLNSTQAPDVYILLMNQQETAVERNSSAWITRSEIDIQIIQKTAFGVSKDPIDTVYESVLEVIFPTIGTIGITVPAGFQFQEGYRESCFTQQVAITETEMAMIEQFKLVFIINQQ